MSSDTIRQQREEKLDDRLYRMRQRADSLERRAAVLCAGFESRRGDWIYATQPANSSRRLARQRRSENDRYGRGRALYAEARELRERADVLERRGVQVAGDAERKRQATREARDQVITVGAIVQDNWGLRGQVERVNKKTYGVRFSTGRYEAIDKAHVTLVRAAQAEEVAA